MLMRAVSPDTAVCEKLPDLRLFRIDFLTLPALFSGSGAEGGEGSVTVDDPCMDVWFEGLLLG